MLTGKSLVATAAAALSIGLGAARAETIPFAAHRAVYDLSLLKSNGRKAPEGVTGRIILEFTGSACEGYVTNFRQVTELQPAEGDAHVADMRSTTFEDAEAKVFNFKIETKVDQVTTETIDGTASHSGNGAMSIKLQKPMSAKLDRASGILFPTEHMRHILDTARDGGKLIETQAYDGSGNGEKVFNTLTVIGAPITAPAEEKPVQIEPLKSMRRWPVTISYFDVQTPDQPPQYVMGFDLYENGIARALKIDYGDFTLSGDMTDLAYLGDGACKK